MIVGFPLLTQASLCNHRPFYILFITTQDEKTSIASDLAAELASSLAAAQPAAAAAQAELAAAAARLTANGGLGVAAAAAVATVVALLPGPREALLARISGKTPAQRAEDLRKQLAGQQSEVSRLKAQAQAAQREFERSQARLRSTRDTLDSLGSLLNRSRQQRKVRRERGGGFACSLPADL